MEVSVRLLCEENAISFKAVEHFIDDCSEDYCILKDELTQDIYIERIDVEDFLRDFEDYYIKKVKAHQVDIENYIESFFFEVHE